MDYNTRLWKSKAAVAFKPGEPLQIVGIDVEEPKAKEVIVKILHTDEKNPAYLVVIRFNVYR